MKRCNESINLFKGVERSKKIRQLSDPFFFQPLEGVCEFIPPPWELSFSLGDALQTPQTRSEFAPFAEHSPRQKH